jgi:peptide chain release factor 1
MQTFTVGGHGGGGKDTSNSGVRLIHRASGAVGEGRDHRSNTMNRRDALARLAETKEFKLWHKQECDRLLGRSQEDVVVRNDAGFGASKIRTYNFPENRTKDHRTGVMLETSSVMEGKIEPFISAMIKEK